MVPHYIRPFRIRSVPGLAYGGDSAFDPLSLSPAMFLSPAGPFFSDLGTTQVTTDGSAVRRWADVSGNGRHADAPNDSARPTLRVSGGKKWLEFDAIDDRLVIASVAAKPFGAFAAYRPAAVTGAEQALVSGSGSQKFKAVSSTKLLGGRDLAYNWTASATAQSVGVDYRIGLAYGSSGAATYYLNGVADGIADSDVSDDTLGSVTVVGGNASGSELLNGRLYSALLFTTLLSADQISRLDSYLRGLLP